MIKSLILFTVTTFTLGAFAAETAPAGALTDGQIAKALITINEGEIDAGDLAKGKAQKQEVKDFAKMMIDQHKQNKKDTKSVADKNKIDTKDSDMSKNLKEELKTMAKDLKKSDKNAFDKAYVNAMVDGHQKVLDTIDNTFMPAAQNADLKAHLAKTRDAVATHLDHAKKLQMAL